MVEENNNMFEWHSTIGPTEMLSNNFRKRPKEIVMIMTPKQNEMSRAIRQVGRFPLYAECDTIR